jgi:putative SOS response-associated peptidase YedK
MCSRYSPLKTEFLLNEFFVVSGIDQPVKDELFPMYQGPFIRRHEFADVRDEAVPSRELLIGSFGMVPQWAEPKLARQTYNARSETVHEKPSFRDAWKRSRHCIIPAAAIYEPDWRTGKAIPTKIVRSDGKPMGIAGLWTEKKLADNQILHSFTMLTINADDHPFMRNYHKPEDEKRMIVILLDDEYEAWLTAQPEESRYFLRQFPADQMTVSPPPDL